MQSCEIIGDRFAARITFVAEQDIENNRSAVRITKVEMKSVWNLSAPSSCWLKGTITINGSTAAVLDLTNTTSCAITLRQDAYDGGGADTWSGFTANDVWVNAAADGTAAITIKAQIKVFLTTQTQLPPQLDNSITVELPRIPRVSEMTAEAVELGQTMTIAIRRASEEFSDTIAWVCGSASGTIAQKTTAASVTWAVPLTLAYQAPNGTQVTVALTVTTWQGDTEVGSATMEIICRIPDSVKPTLAVTVSDRTGYSGQYGGYIQSQSQARVVSQAGGVYGSTITGIAVRCGNLTAQGADVAFELPNSGTVAISVTATDSRGRTAAWNTTISVIAYQMPQVNITEAVRCDQYGAEDPEGGWLKIVFDASVTAIAGNTAAYRGICTVHGGGESREVLLTDYAGKLTVVAGSVLFSAGIDAAFECCIQVTDAFTTVRSALALVGVAFALIDFCKATQAVGIGMRANTAGTLSIGLQMDMAEHGIGNLPNPVEDQDAATKSYVDGRIAAIGGGGSGTVVQAGFAAPEMYGAAGDGVTDDTAAIQQAVDKNYRIRLGDNKTYRITKSIVLRNGVEFFGGVNTVLKNTTQTGIWKQCLIAGFVGAMEQTTAPSKLPSIAVTVSGNTATGTGLGSSCAVGDIVMIHGSEYVDVSAGSGRYKNYRDFQIERVMSVSGNTITLEHPIDVPMTSYAATVLKDFDIINEDSTLHGFVVSDVYVHDLTFQCALDPNRSSAWYTVFFCGYNSRFENLRYDNCPSCFGCNLAAYSVFKNISGTTYDSFADMPEYQFRNIYSDWDIVKGAHIVNNLMFAATHGYGNLFRNLRLKTTEINDGPMLSITNSREITVVGCEFTGNGLGTIIPFHEGGKASVFDGNVFDVEYQAINVMDKSRNAKITNNIVRSGNLFYLSAAVSDGNGARDRGIYAANNVMAGREPIEESINTQIRTSSPISLFSGSRYPVVGDWIETEFVTDSACSLVFSVKLGSKVQTLNAITHPAGYFRAGIYFIANSLYRFVYADNSGGYFSQIYKGLNGEENSIRDIAITVKDSSGASISGSQIGRRYALNQYGYAIMGRGDDAVV